MRHVVVDGHDVDPGLAEARENDLKLVNEDGDALFVDVTELKADFEGKIPVGVPGRLRKIYRESFLVQ